MRLRAIGISIVLAFASPCLLAADTSWYQNAAFYCDDPFALQSTYMNRNWYSTYLDLHLTLVSQEKGYVQIGKADYENWLAQGGQGGLLERRTLTASDAGALRSHLATIADDRVVPTTTSIVSSLLGYLGASTFLTKGLIKYLNGQASAQAAKATTIETLTASGGSVSRILTAARTPTERSYLIHTFEYGVQLGSEQRHFATVSCTYPVKLVFTEFRTTQPANKKILRNLGGSTWGLINADTNVQEQTWTESDRDDDYLYFLESSTDTYRVSLNNGPIEKRVGGQWYKLYQTTTSK